MARRWPVIRNSPVIDFADAADGRAGGGEAGGEGEGAAGRVRGEGRGEESRSSVPDTASAVFQRRY